jgi:hypothetical protein
MRFFVLVLIGSLFGSSLASAGESLMVRATRNYIANYAFALVLEGACKAWRLDRFKALSARNAFGIGDDDFADGGKHHAEFMASVSHFKTIVAEMDNDLACDTAKNAYGPSGTLVKDWMTSR